MPAIITQTEHNTGTGHEASLETLYYMHKLTQNLWESLQKMNSRTRIPVTASCMVLYLKASRGENPPAPPSPPSP